MTCAGADTQVLLLQKLEFVCKAAVPLLVNYFAGMEEIEFDFDNLMVRIHCIIVMIRWTGHAPWEFEFLFPVSRTSTFLVQVWKLFFS